jgi:TonB-dependent receptor
MRARLIAARRLRPALGLTLAAVAFAWSDRPAAAQPPATATIEGRVIDSASALRLENARISLVGTERSTLTDSSGQYRLTNVPVGPVQLLVFYTGLGVQTENLNAASGATIRHDIDLGGANSPVEMSRYEVTAARQLDGEAIAINEQRFASNMKSVIASDEFGTVAEGNVAQLMKFLPGVQVQTDANAIKLGGVPSEYTPVTVAGFDLASAGQSGTSRIVEVDQVSTNSIARIEVINSPMPESPGTALAGSVNFVPFSAFDRTKPTFRVSTYLTARSNALDLHETPGPRKDPTRKVLPGIDFAFIVPVNERFGYTISGGASQSYLPTAAVQNTWTGSGSASNGAGLPDTPPDKPYLTSFQVRDMTNTQTRASLSTTFDYKIAANSQVAFSLSYGSFGSVRANRSLTFNVNSVLPGNFGATFTHGASGAGDFSVQNVERERTGRTIMPTLTFRHNGPTWKAEAGLGLSLASNEFLDTSKGYFNTTLARRTGVTISFDGIAYLRPAAITVTSATGVAIDPFQISSYAVSTANSNTSEAADSKRRVYANLRRDFNLLGAYAALKGGLDVRQSVRDIRGQTTPFTFVGADGRASTTPVGSDDAATQFLDANFSQRPGPFGLHSIQWLSNEELWQHYQRNPAHYTVNESQAYINGINLSQRAGEIISAAYLRGDLHLLQGRLKLVGGVRGEQTNDDAEGPLNNPSLNFQRDSSGNFILGSNRLPLPITTNVVEVAKRTRIDRGKHTEKEYLRWLPTLNASYDVRPDLIARLAYYHSLGRPDFNQYAGPLTLPDLGLGPTATNRIAVNNADIKAWSAESLRASLEYYFGQAGVLSAGVFRRKFENFFATQVTAATPEFLSLYNLESNLYGGYDVSTQANTAQTLRMEGLDLSYKQALTMLPAWARGVQVFANASFLRSVDAAVFNDFTPRCYSWGIKLTRPKLSLATSWNYRSDYLRSNVAAGRSIEPNTALYTHSSLILDVSAEYRLSRRYALYAAVRNWTDQPVPYRLERFGPGTPDYARLREWDKSGALLTLGLKAVF